MYEALFRWSLVRMALEQTGLRASRLRRTTAAKTLDPTEKGAVNYFLGMTFCKLFAAKLLHTPWLLHLDVFRPGLNPEPMRGCTTTSPCSTRFGYRIPMPCGGTKARSSTSKVPTSRWEYTLQLRSISTTCRE